LETFASDHTERETASLIGHAGVASGLAELVTASLCLYQQILPPPRGPQYWLRNRIEGPRRAAVCSNSNSGHFLYVILEENESSAAGAAADQLQPLGARSDALFVIEGRSVPELRKRLRQLREKVRSWADCPVEAQARQWWREHGTNARLPLGLALV